MTTNSAENVTFENWAGTIRFKPTRTCKPTTYAELAAALERAAAEKRRVRAVGSGHSWSLGVVPGDAPYQHDGTADGDLIDLSALSPENERNDPGLKAVFFKLSDTSYVAVPPGATQGFLLDIAHENGKAVLTAGPAPSITLGGFIANGCHGSGWEQLTVPDLVDALEIMSVDDKGKAVRTVFVSDTDLLQALYDRGIVGKDVRVKTEMDAARVSLGAFGIITKVVLRIDDNYRYRVLDEYAEEDQLFPEGENPSLDVLEELVTSSDYVMLFWFALNNYNPRSKNQTNEIWIKRFKRTLEKPRVEFKVNLMNQVIAKAAASIGRRPGPRIARNPASAPRILRRNWEVLKLTMWRRLKRPNFTADFEYPWRLPPIVHARDAFLFQREYFHNLMDFAYAFPIPQRSGGGYDFSTVRKAYQMAVDELYRLAADNHYPVTINIVLRFIKNSNAWLSPAKQRDDSTHTCYIECVTYREQAPELRRFAETIGPAWAKLGGFPHWAKKLDDVPGAYEDAHAKLIERGDLLQRFNEIRREMDPNGLFRNDFLARLLDGRPGAPVTTTPRPTGSDQGEPEEPLTLIASKTLPLSPAILGDRDGIISDGKRQMRHDELEHQAMMVDESGDAHVLDYRDTGTGERTYDLMTRPDKLTPDQVFQRIESIFTSTVFADEADALTVARAANDRDPSKISNPILIHNGTPHRLRLRFSDSWNGEFKDLLPAQEIDAYLWAGAFHREIKGSEGCVVYRLIDDDDRPICDVFIGFSSPRGIRRNRVYVEVREPDHWWNVGSRDHMYDLLRQKGSYDEADSRSFGGVKVVITGHVDKGNEPTTVFRLS